MDLPQGFRKTFNAKILNPELAHVNPRKCFECSTQLLPLHAALQPILHPSSLSSCYNQVAVHTFISEIRCHS